ncbi:MAG: hypothetical protein K8R77_07450 [Anaerolineaceae bacterium]|nr:hypothetical protein [Anaerolineaceae bacterium]
MASDTVARYCIHGICTFDILDQVGPVVQKLLDVQGRYQCFKTDYDPAVSPDLRVTIGKFQPDLHGCTSLDGAYWVKTGYLYHSGETYKMGAGWSFDVAGLESSTIEVRINANFPGRPFIAGKIIDFFIFWLLQQHECSLMHASAVAHEGDVFVFAARGGGGKTTLALAATFNQGMQFMGDNFVILKNGMIYSYLSDLNMFGYNLHPRVWESLTRYECLRFKFWQLVHRFTFGYIKVFSAVSPLRFLQGASCDSGRLKKLTMLQTFGQFSCNPLVREALTAQMTSNMKLEFFSFVRHVAVYGCVFPDTAFANFWQSYTETLQDNLPQAEIQRMTLPPHITDKIKAQALAAGLGE